MTSISKDVWESTVRNYEVDCQGIVESVLSRVSRFKFQFSQKIVLQKESELICVSAESIVAAVDSVGKPKIIKELEYFF